MNTIRQVNQNRVPLYNWPVKGCDATSVLNDKHVAVQYLQKYYLFYFLMNVPCGAGFNIVEYTVWF